jgi:hypothetical protein
MRSIMHQKWSDTSLWESYRPCDPLPEPAASLDFLAAAATSRANTYDYSLLGLIRRGVEVAGVGATSVVQVGKTHDRSFIALKIDRGASQPSSGAETGYYGQHLSQLATELRILSHARLKRNPHILDLLGFLLDEHADSFSCSLAEEYSDLSDLRSFLQSTPSLPIHQRLFFGLGIARYLVSEAFQPPPLLGMQHALKDMSL